MTNEFEENHELNDENRNEFDDFREYDSDKYRNFDHVDEYHNRYEELHENEGKDPPSEEDEVEENRRRHLSLPTAQVLATTVVALVVVSAILIPALDNKDVEVSLDGKLISSELYFFASLSHYSEDTPYYIIVLKDGEIVHQQVIDNGFCEGTIAADPSMPYTLEVRTGSPPLLVIASIIIDSGGVWADLIYLNVGANSADFGIELHGKGIAVDVSVYDTEEMATVYSNTMEEGTLEDTVSGLTSGRLYYLTVSTADHTYLFEEFTTNT